MIKPIKLKGSSLQVKCKCILELCFSGCSDSELEILALLIQYSTNNSITLTVDLARQIRQSAGVGESSFSTHLFRLDKKGIMVRQGKTITFHPIFNKIQETEKLLITFVGEEIKKDLPEISESEMK